MWEKESIIDVQCRQENPNPRVHHSSGKLSKPRFPLERWTLGLGFSWPHWTPMVDSICLKSGKIGVSIGRLSLRNFTLMAGLLVCLPTLLNMYDYVLATPCHWFQHTKSFHHSISTFNKSLPSTTRWWAEQGVVGWYWGKDKVRL